MRLDCWTLVTFLLLVPVIAWADCDLGVADGATMPRTGLHKLNYRQCNWEVEHNQNIDIMELARNAGEATLRGITATNWDGFVWFFAPQALTLIDIGCYCQGTVTTLPTFTFTSVVTGNAVGTATLTCATNGAPIPFVAFDIGDADRILVQGGGMSVTVTNAPTLQDCTLVPRW